MSAALPQTLCPICKGRGTHSEVIDNNPNHTLSYVCKGCYGEGWIDVDAETPKERKKEDL